MHPGRGEAAVAGRAPRAGALRADFQHGGMVERLVPTGTARMLCPCMPMLVDPPTRATTLCLPSERATLFIFFSGRWVSSGRMAFVQAHTCVLEPAVFLWPIKHGLPRVG